MQIIAWLLSRFTVNILASFSVISTSISSNILSQIQPKKRYSLVTASQFCEMSGNSRRQKYSKSLPRQSSDNAQNYDDPLNRNAIVTLFGRILDYNIARFKRNQQAS